MPLTPLFGLSQQGKSAAVTAQSHLNLYADISPDPDKARIAFYGTPGLVLDYSYGDTPVRGSISTGDFKYEVHRGTVYKVNNAGTRTALGTISTTTGRVRMAYNGVQVGFVDGAHMYVITTATDALVTVASGLGPNPTDITYDNGYFIVTFAGDGRFQISDLYDGTVFDPLDYSTAESNPDPLERVIADHGEIVMCGTKTVEFWGATGALDFPYASMAGSQVGFGLAAPDSLTTFNDSLAGLFRSEMGQVQVMMLAGHAIKPISTPELDYLINGYATVGDATAFSYMLGGHPMLQVNFPSAGKSWLYDALTGLWSPLESGLSGGRARGEIRTDYLNKVRVTDYQNGNVYSLSADSTTDNGTPVPREIITRHFYSDGKPVAVHSLQVEFEMGVGLQNGQGSDPQVMLQVSKDGGKTWGNEMWRSLGATGDYRARAKWNRLGAARDWVFKLRVTDPVKVVITNAYLDAGVRL